MVWTRIVVRKRETYSWEIKLIRVGKRLSIRVGHVDWEEDDVHFFTWLITHSAIHWERWIWIGIGVLGSRAKKIWSGHVTINFKFKNFVKLSIQISG